MNKKYNVYLAGPLFTQAEIMWNGALSQIVEVKWRIHKSKEWSDTELNMILPSERCAIYFPPHTITPNWMKIYDECISSIEESDIVIAILDGADADSGTCFEVGYAKAKGYKVIGIRTDMRPTEAGLSNTMLQHSCDIVIDGKETSITDLAEIVVSTLQTLKS